MACDNDNYPGDDSKLFRDSIGEVRPVSDDRDESRPSPPAPVPVFSLQDEAMVVSELLLYGPEQMEVECGEELRWHKDGLRPRIMRRLRQGRYSVADELDLHHMRSDEAQLAIIEFVNQARDRQLTCVRIIHGKGLRSRIQPKLKQLTAKLLRRMPGILAYCSARPVDGGTGAVYVLLSRR